MSYRSDNATKKIRDLYFEHARKKIDPKIDSYLVTHNFFDVSIQLRNKNFSSMYLLINKELENA